MKRQAKAIIVDIENKELRKAKTKSVTKCRPKAGILCAYFSLVFGYLKMTHKNQ